MPADPTPFARMGSTRTLAARPSPRVHLPPVHIHEHVNREFHLVLWQVFGESDLVLGGESFALHAGQAVWVPSGMRHGFTTREGSALLPIFIDLEELATALGARGVITVDGDLYALFIAYYETTYTIIRPNVDIARQILALIEDTPVVDADLPLPVSKAALTVAEALRLNPGDGRSVDELAASVHTSSRTIGRAFIAETGLTLRQWRLRNRMEAAGALLRSPTSIDAVAHRVGYTTTSAFRRVFREHFGISPSEFIARYRSAA